MKRILTIYLLTWLSLSCKSGEPSTGSGTLYYVGLFGLIAAPDGGYLVGVTRYHTVPNGSIQAGPASTFSDLMLIKTDAQGNRQWEKVLEKPGGQDGIKLLQVPSGNYLLAGNTVSTQTIVSPDHIDVVLYEIGPDGQERSSSRRVANPGYDLVLTDLHNGPGGSLFAAGYQWHGGVTYDWLTRISQNGSSTQWEYLMPDSTQSLTSTQTLDVAPDGDLLVAGYKSFQGRPQTYFRRTSPDGAIRWTQYASEALQLKPRQLYATADGGFLLMGSGYPSASATNLQVVLLKADANGKTQSLRWFDVGTYQIYYQFSMLSKGPDGTFVLATWQEKKITLTGLDRNGGTPKTIAPSISLYGYNKPLFLAQANGETILVEFTGNTTYEHEITMHRIGSDGKEIWQRVISRQ